MLWVGHTRKAFAVLSVLAVALLALLAGGGLEFGVRAQIGKTLIGKLEGPEVITERTQFPTTFQEAPHLAALVKTGQLPTVAERIGQDPLVIKPVHEIGQYGGTWRRGFTGPADWSAGVRVAGTDRLLGWDYTGSTLVPNIAKGWDVSADGRRITFHLRRGMRWSDGHPFTADDVLFWFEDMYQNPYEDPRCQETDSP